MSAKVLTTAEERDHAREQARRLRALASDLRQLVEQGFLPKHDTTAIAARCDNIAERIEQALDAIARASEWEVPD